MKGVFRASELIGRPVVTLDEAEAIAEVKDVIFSPEKQRVVGFTLNRRGALASPMKRVLPVEHVESIGTDAVMVANAATVCDGTAETDAGESVVGTPVVTERGEAAGEVTDAVVDTREGCDVVGLEVTDEETRRLVPLTQLRGALGDAVVVASFAMTLAPDDLSTLAAAGRDRSER